MRMMIRVTLILLACVLMVTPSLACFVTAGGTLGGPVTDVFGGVASIKKKTDEATGTWIHAVPGNFTFHGKVSYISCYAPDATLIGGRGYYNGTYAWFDVRVEEGSPDHYYFLIYLQPYPVLRLYEAEGDLSAGSITIHPSNNGRP